MQKQEMRGKGGSRRSSAAREHGATASSEIDELANEIFARLNDENRNESIEDLQLHLARAASTLAKPVDASSEAAVQAALQSLPSNQRDALLLHQGGLTCAQIAQRQERAREAVLEDLTSAYVRLRFSFGSS